MDRAALKDAAQEVLAAVVVDDDWTASLQRFAATAGARDAVLMCNRSNGVVAAIATECAVEAVARFATGHTPPNSRYARVRNSIDGGFRADLDDYMPEELDIDPFYQEFLRPNGVFWHANALLGLRAAGEIELSLKRRPQDGPFLRDEISALNAVLPELRAAARLARLRLDSEVRGIRWLFERRGSAVLELDSRGSVLAGQQVEAFESSGVVRVAGRYLVAADAEQNRRLSRAIAAAVGPQSATGAVRLSDGDGLSVIVQVVPLPGIMRRVLGAAAALAVIVDSGRAIDAELARLTTEAYGLTDREATICGLLAAGRDIAAVAAQLRVGRETVRTHLKKVFEKTGVKRQAELAATLARLLP